MCGILLGAAIFGGIISVMEQEFFGWFTLIVCVLAGLIPAIVVSALLPIPFLGLIVGAVCAGVAISAMCGMTLKRSIIAASIYLAIQVCISLLFQLVF